MTQTLKTLRKMLCQPTHRVDQLGALLRDRMQQLGNLAGRLEKEWPVEVHEELGRLDDADVELLAIAVEFTRLSVSRSSVDLQKSSLEQETP